MCFSCIRIERESSSGKEEEEQWGFENVIDDWQKCISMLFFTRILNTPLLCWAAQATIEVPT
jgi:hypothetical protein